MGENERTGNEALYSWSRRTEQWKERQKRREMLMAAYGEVNVLSRKRNVSFWLDANTLGKSVS